MTSVIEAPAGPVARKPAGAAANRPSGTIIHGPVDYANQATRAADGLRRLGVRATCVTRPSGYAFTGADATLPAGRLARAASIVPRLIGCDVLHLYSGESFFPGRLAHGDARWLRRAGRRVVMEFVGTDARLPSLAAASSPYYVAPERFDEKAINKTLARWAELCSGHAIVADHNLDRELGAHFGTIHVVGLRVDTTAYAPAPPAARVKRPVLLHAPSNPRIKGTPAVRRAVNDLHTEGLDFEYVEIQGMTHAQARKQYQRADLVIDQLCIGAHGVFAVEAMSLAKPVVCYIRPDLVDTYPPDLPIINANPDTLTRVLRDWLRNGVDRRELGITSRAYAEREHDIAVVAGRLLAAYDQLPRARR